MIYVTRDNVLENSPLQSNVYASDKNVPTPPESSTYTLSEPCKIARYDRWTSRLKDFRL